MGVEELTIYITEPSDLLKAGQWSLKNISYCFYTAL